MLDFDMYEAELRKAAEKAAQLEAARQEAKLEFTMNWIEGVTSIPELMLDPGNAEEDVQGSYELVQRTQKLANTAESLLAHGQPLFHVDADGEGQVSFDLKDRLYPSHPLCLGRN